MKTSDLRIIFTFLVAQLLILPEVQAQKARIDTLEAPLNNYTDEDTLSVIKLNDLAIQNSKSNVKDLYKYSQQAMVLARKIGYKPGEAMAGKNLALAAMFVHGDVAALKYLDKSLALFTALKDTVNMAHVINYYGCYYATVKDFQQALPYFLKAEKLIAQRDSKIRFSILSNTGSCYVDLKQYSKARVYYGELKNAADSSQDYNRMAISLYQLASLDLIGKDYKKAKNKAEQALAINNKHEISPRTLQIIYILMGDIDFGTKRFKESRKYYENSAAISKQRNSSENMALIYYKYHLLDSIAGNYQLSLKNFKLYQVITDSLMKGSKNDVIALYKVRFSLDKQEAENARLTAEKNKSHEIIYYQRWILFFALLSLLLLTFLFFRLRKLNYKLKDLNGKITLQNKELEELNSIKNKIFSVTAHDLRSPFTQLISMLNMLSSQIIDADDFYELIPLLSKSSGQSLEMMDNLLIWSKSQLNGFRINPVSFEVWTLIEDTLDKLSGPLSEKKLMIELNKSGENYVWADIEMIRIVIRNLLSNAIKFTPQNGKISISADNADNAVVIIISDSGVGMNRQQLDQLFSFDVKSTQGTANEAGSGLGLKISQDLLALNKSNIRAESAPGVGSNFYISIPESQHQFV